MIKAQITSQPPAAQGRWTYWVKTARPFIGLTTSKVNLYRTVGKFKTDDIYFAQS